MDFACCVDIIRIDNRQLLLITTAGRLHVHIPHMIYQRSLIIGDGSLVCKRTNHYVMRIHVTHILDTTDNYLFILVVSDVALLMLAAVF